MLDSRIADLPELVMVVDDDQSLNAFNPHDKEDTPYFGARKDVAAAIAFTQSRISMLEALPELLPGITSDELQSHLVLLKNGLIYLGSPVVEAEMQRRDVRELAAKINEAARVGGLMLAGDDD